MVKEKVSKGYHVFRYLLLDGRIQRRLCTILGDRAYVHSERRGRNGEYARIMRSDLLFKTEAEALGGDDQTLFVCHDERYEKIRARSTGDGRWLQVDSSGGLSRVYGQIFKSEIEAVDYCLGVLQKQSSRLLEMARKLKAKHKELSARKKSEKSARSRARF